MTLDNAKALTLSLFPTYPWVAVVDRNRLIFETIEDLIGKGYAHKPFTPITEADRTAAEKAVEKYAYESPNWEPRDITRSDTNLWEMSIVMGLMRNPPANLPKPGEGYTQADLDTAYKDGWNAALELVDAALYNVDAALKGARR